MFTWNPELEVTDDQVLDVERLGGVPGVLVHDLACARREAATYTVGRLVTSRW
jgi:hypothetical protein